MNVPLQCDDWNLFNTAMFLLTSKSDFMRHRDWQVCLCLSTDPPLTNNEQTCSLQLTDSVYYMYSLLHDWTKPDSQISRCGFHLNRPIRVPSQFHKRWQTQIPRPQGQPFQELMSKWNQPSTNNYSLCQKKSTFNFEFFVGPLGEGGPRIHMVNSRSPLCECVENLDSPPSTCLKKIGSPPILIPQKVRPPL